MSPVEEEVQSTIDIETYQAELAKLVEPYRSETTSVLDRIDSLGRRTASILKATDKDEDEAQKLLTERHELIDTPNVYLVEMAKLTAEMLLALPSEERGKVSEAIDHAIGHEPDAHDLIPKLWKLTAFQVAERAQTA